MLKSQKLQWQTNVLQEMNLQKKAKVAEVTLTKIKAGKNFKPVTIGKIAKALKVKVEDLI